MNRSLTPKNLFSPRNRSWLNAPFSNLFPDLWEEAEHRLGQWWGSEQNEGISVSEDGQKVYVEAHLPGLKASEIDISLHQNRLTIQGERKEEENNQQRKFYRQARTAFFYQVELPSPVNERQEQAEFQDGVLRITFEKAQKSQIHKISVHSGNQKEHKSH